MLPQWKKKFISGQSISNIATDQLSLCKFVLKIFGSCLECGTPIRGEGDRREREMDGREREIDR